MALEPKTSDSAKCHFERAERRGLTAEDSSDEARGVLPRGRQRYKQMNPQHQIDGQAGDSD